MPFLYPTLIFHEEGFYIHDNILISPDGSLKNKNGVTVYAFEGKSPVGNDYTTTVQYNIPERYMAQTLFESRVTNAASGTVYLSWSNESATLFTVPYTNLLCE